MRSRVLDPVHQEEVFPPGGLRSEARAALQALEVGLAGLVLTDVGEEGGSVGLGEVAVRAGEGSPVRLGPHHTPAGEGLRAVEQSVEEDQILP